MGEDRESGGCGVKNDEMQKLSDGFQLICDAPGCGHAERVGPLRPSLIGTRCPKCGSDMLTREDYFAAVRCVGTLRLLTVLGLARAPKDDEEGLLVNARASGWKVEKKVAGAA